MSEETGPRRQTPEDQLPTPAFQQAAVGVEAALPQSSETAGLSAPADEGQNGHASRLEWGQQSEEIAESTGWLGRIAVQTTEGQRKGLPLGAEQRTVQNQFLELEQERVHE